jgi:4-amino-4-deoxy-L-arabinose transferase-like glycosyltransferase
MRRELIVILIILAVAGFFRLYNLDAAPPGLYPDEAVNANDAMQALASGEYKVFYPDNNGREGLYVNILAFFFNLFGSSIWVLRFVSALIGILTILFLYLLAREMFNWQIAALSSFFMAISFWHVNFSRIAFRGILIPLLTVLVAYFLWRGFKYLSNKDFLLSGVFLGLGMYTYIPFRLVPLIVIAALLVFWQKIKKDYSLSKYEDFRNRFIVGFAYILVASLLIAGPILFFAYDNPDTFLARSGQISIFAADNPVKELVFSVGKTLPMFNFIGDLNWRHNLSGASQLFWGIGMLFLVGIIRSFWKCFRMKREHGHYSTAQVLLLAWFFILLIPSFLSAEGIPHALRSIGVIPVAMIFAGEGAWWVFDKLRDWYAAGDVKHEGGHLFHKLAKSRASEGNGIALLVLIVFLSILTWHQYDAYFNKWANRPETAAHFSKSLVDLADEINMTPADIPKYVIMDVDGWISGIIPLQTEPIMFITQTYTKELQEEKNIHYIFPDETHKIPWGAVTFKMSGN